MARLGRDRHPAATHDAKQDRAPPPIQPTPNQRPREKENVPASCPQWAAGCQGRRSQGVPGRGRAGFSPRATSFELRQPKTWGRCGAIQLKDRWCGARWLVRRLTIRQCRHWLVRAPPMPQGANHWHCGHRKGHCLSDQQKSRGGQSPNEEGGKNSSRQSVKLSGWD
jgi:hypothetical protein